MPSNIAHKLVKGETCKAPAGSVQERFPTKISIFLDTRPNGTEFPGKDFCNFLNDFPYLRELLLL